MFPTVGFGRGFGPGFRFGNDPKENKKGLKPIINKGPSGPRRAGPGYIQGRGQARGTSKWSNPD